MGNQNKSFKSLFYYYLFQERIHKVLNNDYSDIKGINTGYIIQENWIEEWKKINNCGGLYNTLKQLNITSESLSDSQKQNIEIKYKKIIFYKPYNPFIIENNFMSLEDKIIPNENYLKNFIDEKTFEKLNISHKNKYEKIEYIFLQNMIIFFFKEKLVIKFLINHSLIKNLTIKSNKLINLKILFFKNKELYKSFRYYFSNRKNTSEKIINYLNDFKTFEIDKNEDINNIIRESMPSEEYLKKHQKELEKMKLKDKG